MPSEFRTEVAQAFSSGINAVGYSEPRNVRLGKGDGSGTIVYDASKRLIWWFEGELGGVITSQGWAFLPSGVGVLPHDSKNDEGSPIQIRLGPGETVPEVFKLMPDAYIPNSGRTPAEQAQDRAAIPTLAQLDHLRLRVVSNSNVVTAKGRVYYDDAVTGDRRFVVDPALDLDGDITELESGEQQLAVVYLDARTGKLGRALGAIVPTGDTLPKRSTFKDYSVANVVLPSHTVPMMGVYLYFGQALNDDDLYRVYDLRPLFAPLIRNVYGATAAPTVDDDESRGFGIGSLVIYDGVAYICTDPTIGAAVWARITSGAGTGDFLADGTVPMTGALDLDGNSLINANTIEVIEGTAPSTPASGHGAIYEKTDGLLYFKNDAGAEYDLTGGGGGGIDSGVYASLPTAGNAGAAYLPTDSYYWMIDDGAAWDARGPIFRCVVPPASGWSWDNQGSAAIDITRGSHSLNAPGATGLQLRGRYRTAPTPPYKITAQLITSMPGVANSTVGLYFRQSSDGKIACFSQNGQMLMLSQTFSNPSGGSVSNYLVGGDTAPYSGMGYPRFMRIEDDGVNRICSWSYDGVNFVVFHSVSRTDYLTADQVGFYVFVNSTSESIATLLSWEVS